MLQFNNTEIAFSSKSKKELRSAFWLFKTIQKSWVVNLGNKMLAIALYLKFPIKWALKPTIFKHFCGGETINECDIVISELANNNIGSILDFSAEGNHTDLDFEFVMKEILKVIQKSKSNKSIPFAVFKVSGIARFELLEKINEKKILTAAESKEFDKVKERIDVLCNAAAEAELPLLFDAEESWIQDAIDIITIQMMQKHNQTKAIIYNTLQMYRCDRIDFFNKCIKTAREQHYCLGFKIVRGAYMEKERERASLMAYPSPIHINKLSTDNDYDKALAVCIANSDIISVCAGSHNEKSNAILTALIAEKNLDKEDKRFYFAQLLGMSDHISYNLAHNGFNVAKYVPYGPLESVLPYLIRRAQENTSIAGQTGRELNLISNELKRRKSL